MMEKQKKKTGLARLFEIAGERKGLLVLAGLLSAASACCMLVPYWAVYKILNELLLHAGDLGGNEIIHLYKLSSGEKQLLIILLRVFLMDEQPYILLMDEPEISLHIEWQYRLFEEIQKLNPYCQIITSTHSPSLFGDGWGDKLVFIEDLLIP